MLATFLHDLFTTGRVRLDQTAAGHTSVSDLLIDREAAIRCELAGPPPPFSLVAATAAADWMLAACQRLVDPTAALPPSTLAAEPGSATDCHSVDLVLSFLPDLKRLATATARSDDLNGAIDRLAAMWPLSGAGCGVPPESLDAVWSQESLRVRYCERIVRAGELAIDDRVRREIAARLGAHPELAAATLAVPETT